MEVNKAGLDSGEDAERAALVQAYRKRIRAWHQQRDFQVATWYRDRGRPTGARYYFGQVIKREATSALGREAERELAQLPAANDDPFGDVLPARP